MLIVNIVLNIIILINLTLIAGILPLIERKYLSLIQRRVGPTFTGYKGRLQFIADALKMFLKGCIIPNRVNNFYYLLYPALVLSLCYLFWLNTYWGVNLIFFELEYNIVFLGILSSFIGFFTILTGVYSSNKYALMAALRTILMIFCLELLLGLLFLNLVLIINSFNFSFLLILQQEYYLFGIFFLIYNSLIIVVLMEINRAPFDLSEAENELISGYHVEYGAFFFGLFYLGEYFHLFFFSVTVILMCFGI